MMNRILKVITILGIIMMVIVLFFLNRDPGFSGYNKPDSIEAYGISGKEKTWTISEFFEFSPDEVSNVSISRNERVLLYLENQQETEYFTDTIENCFTVVDQKSKYDLAYRMQWEPYVFAFQLNDGTKVEFGLSVIKEPSRILYVGDELYEVLVQEDIIFLLEREFDMSR